MNRWQRIRRAFGSTWRRPAECPHPAERERTGGPLMTWRFCRDCGRVLGIWNGRGFDMFREPYK